ncbi:MAG: SH3 domain-containing protein [Anaerolineae bacterium]|nr:SH3 domain-containing protein [Anaerolineae bacterium]
MKHSRLFFVLSLVVILLLTTIVSVAQVGIVGAVEIELTLRVGPGTQWRTLTTMPIGTNVALDGRDTSGLWVRGITQNSTVGWMAARYLTVTTDAVFALPVIDREAAISVSVPPPGNVAVVAAAPAEVSQPEAAASNAPIEGGTIATATATVNIRSGPSTQYRILGLLRAGAQFNIDGRDSSVGWVRGISPNGTVGWVSAAYINLNYTQVAGLPFVNISSPFGLGTPAGSSATTATTDSAAPAAPVVSTTPITGFGYGGHVRGLDEVSVNYMRIAGMSWAKYQVRYTQGDNPGAIAGLINDAHAKGFRVLLGVVGLPQQVNNGGYFESYASFVGALAAQGADAIEVWNEMNLDREWPRDQIDPGRYTQLLAQAFNAIKANNPNTLVITGALAPTGAEAAFPGQVWNDNRYLSGMVAAGALNYADCVGIHYNEGIVPPTQNAGDPRGDSYYTRFYNGMVNTYWSIIGGRRPLCFTELGYLTPEGFPPLPGHFGWAQNVTVAQQAAWLDQVMGMARRSGRVRIVIIWNINFQQYGADPMGGYAIIRPGGGCPACFALGN